MQKILAMLVGLMAAGSAMTGAPAAAATAQSSKFTPATAADVDQNKQASLLAGSILTEVRNPSYSTAEDYEGAIMFVLGQKDYSLPTMVTSLDIAEAAPGLNDPTKTAIDRVRAALRDRYRRGTGAIGGTGATAGFGNTGFSFPVISIGGGSSNYSR